MILCQYDFFVMSKILNEEISKGRIEKIYNLIDLNEDTKDKNNIVQIFKFKIYRKGKKDLVFTNDCIYINKEEDVNNYVEINLKPPIQPISFVMLLRKHLENKYIENVRQINKDKILCLETKDNYLYLEFFGGGNVILCDKENKIIGALIEREWKGRKIYKKEIYKFPEVNFDEKMFFGRYYKDIEAFSNSKDFDKCIEILKNKEQEVKQIFKNLVIEELKKCEQKKDDSYLKELKKLEFIAKSQHEKIKELRKEMEENYAIANFLYENFEIFSKILQNAKNEILSETFEKDNQKISIKKKENNIIFVEVKTKENQDKK